MGVYRAPLTPGQRWHAGNGVATPAAGYLLFQYLAGTNNPQATFTDATGATPNANPVALDANGSLDGAGPGGTAVDVWFSGGVAYKLVLTDTSAAPAPGNVVWSSDNLTGDNDPAFATGGVGEWLDGPALTWVSSAATGTVATCAQDQTTLFTKGRRVRLTDANGIRYGAVAASAFAAGTGLTTVTFIMDGGTVILNPITGSAYALNNAENVSIPADPAGAFALPDADATVTRGHARTVHQTPTAARNWTLNNSFLEGDQRWLENRAAAFNATIKANDGTTVATLPPGRKVLVEPTTDNPATNTDWKCGAMLLPVTADAFGAGDAHEIKNSAGTTHEFGGGASGRRLAAVGVDTGANYVDSVGTSGADNTAQTVKSITLKGNSINAAGRAVRLKAFGLASTATVITVDLYINGVKISTIGAADYSAGFFFYLDVYYLDATHVLYFGIQERFLAGGNIRSWLTSLSKAGMNNAADQLIEIKQSAAVGTHIQVNLMRLEQLG